MADDEQPCPHAAWEERGGSWRVCTDCGYGWSGPQAVDPMDLVPALRRVQVGHGEAVSIEGIGSRVWVRLYLTDGRELTFDCDPNQAEQFASAVADSAVQAQA